MFNEAMIMSGVGRCVCMCLHVYVCVHVYVGHNCVGCMYVYACEMDSVCMCVCVCVCVCACARAGVCLHVSVLASIHCEQKMEERGKEIEQVRMLSGRLQ